METNEKRRMKEEKEIARLEKEKNRSRFAGYLLLFLFIITVVYFVDEIATNISKFMELDVTSYFFGSATEMSKNASSIRAITTTCISVIAGVAMFLRPLADRFGRKIFLCIYTLGMGVAMMIIAISNHIYGWMAGTLLINICIPHDMQQVYIQECAPKEKRGTYFFMIKGLASLSLMIVPILRKLLNVDKDISRFKIVYLIVGIIGIIAAILACFFMRESDVWIDERLSYLRLPLEEKERLKKEKKDEAKRGGIISGFLYMFKHRQLRWLLISMCLIMATYVLTDNYNTILACGKIVHEGGVIGAYESVSYLSTQAVLIYPIGCGLVVLLPGFISDRFGRKNAAVVFGVFAVVSYTLFYIGSNLAWSAYFLGFLIGFACGSIWSCGDLILLMVTESSSTNMRVSANACALLMAGVAYVICQTIVGTIGASLSDSYLGLITIIIVAICLTIGITIMMLKVKETKGTDLHNIKVD